MEKKKVLLLAGGASIVCTVVICVILVLIWLFNQDDEEDDTSSSTSKSPSPGSPGSPRSPRSPISGSGGATDSGSIEDEEIVVAEDYSGSSCIGIWSQPSSTCSATRTATQTFRVTNGTECVDNSIGPTYGQTLRDGTTRQTTVPACIQGCDGQWSSWSGCPAGGSCNDETRTFTVTREPAPGADCSRFGANFAAGGAYVGATYRQTRACTRPAAGCSTTCSNDRWETQACSVGCGDGTQIDIYQGTDGTDGNSVCIAGGGALFGTRRPTPQPAASGRAAGVCNLGSCCATGSFTAWRRNGSLNCIPPRPEQQWVREPYYGRVVEQDCLLRTNVVTTGSAEGCEPRLNKNAATRCVQPGFSYSTATGCTPVYVANIGITACRSDTVTEESSTNTCNTTWSLTNGSCEKTKVCNQEHCFRNCTSTTRTTDTSAMTSWTCPPGYVMDTIKGRCKPAAATSLPVVGDMQCDPDFTPDAASNRCIPGPTPVSATAPPAGECATDRLGICPTSTPTRTVQIRSTRTGSSSDYSIEIINVTNVETQNITINFYSENAYTGAIAVITADFPDSLFSNASQNIVVDIPEGDGSFNARTHVSTWDMYTGKSVTIYDSSGTYQLSNSFTFF